VEDAEKDVCYNGGNNNANNVSTQTKPAESLLHDDKDDNDEVFSAISVCENHGVYMRKLDSGYQKRHFC
jgi:hypothetical protein